MCTSSLLAVRRSSLFFTWIAPLSSLFLTSMLPYWLHAECSFRCFTSCLAEYSNCCRYFVSESFRYKLLAGFPKARVSWFLEWRIDRCNEKSSGGKIKMGTHFFFILAYRPYLSDYWPLKNGSPIKMSGHFGFLIFTDLYGFITDILITLWSVIRIYTDL